AVFSAVSRTVGPGAVPLEGGGRKTRRSRHGGAGEDPGGTPANGSMIPKGQDGNRFTPMEYDDVMDQDRRTQVLGPADDDGDDADDDGDDAEQPVSCEPKWWYTGDMDIDEFLQRDINRRRFLGQGAAGAAGMAASAVGIGHAIAADSPSDQVRLGVVGVRSQGKALALTAAESPGMRVVSVCDVDESLRGRAVEAVA